MDAHVDLFEDVAETCGVQCHGDGVPGITGLKRDKQGKSVEQSEERRGEGGREGGRERKRERERERESRKRERERGGGGEGAGVRELLERET